MINAHFNEQVRLRRGALSVDYPGALVWPDLVEPIKDDERNIETALGTEMPAREKMAGIEISSRRYYEGSNVCMTTTLPSHPDSDEPILGPVMFILTERQPISVRCNEPRAFKTLLLQGAKTPVVGEGGTSSALSWSGAPTIGLAQTLAAMPACAVRLASAATSQAHFSINKALVRAAAHLRRALGQQTAARFDAIASRQIRSLVWHSNPVQP